MSFGSRSSSTATTLTRTFGRAHPGFVPSRAFESSNSEAGARDSSNGAEHSGASARPGHDLSRIGVYDGKGHGPEEAPDRAAIASSGSPTVTVTYTPEAADKSTKIVFIQVAQFSLDGKPTKPGTLSADFAHMDADTTSDFYVVDHLSGETDPYYNGDDAADGGTQGNATSTPAVAADMTDTPNYRDTSFPAGKATAVIDFHTIAFSAAGADKGKFYAYAHWSYTKPKGKAATIMHLNTSTNTALPKSKAAIDLWCSNHGFTLPK